MTKKLSKNRRNLLAQLESMIGNECYNASIQNYGPGGSREADGRAFRYPLTIRIDDENKQKIRSKRIPDTISDQSLRSGYYSFGANQLDVMKALNDILVYLEKNHGLNVENRK
ncbi:hypothetical protein [Vreelandella venusta]|uniref:hypothetical protein n=1 Tax=Vreelandella venusta TaxID=44935 RepID=UPI00200CB600|nr:hypothetical protein [Halomonas venusta]UQI40986.1 hypothetical protein M3L73_01620 [Halomonas venusta]